MAVNAKTRVDLDRQLISNCNLLRSMKKKIDELKDSIDSMPDPYLVDTMGYTDGAGGTDDEVQEVRDTAVAFAAISTTIEANMILLKVVGDVST